MPYKRNYRKRTKRRRRYKKKDTNLFLSGSRKSFPLPTKFKTTLRYSERLLALNPAIGGIAAEQVYSTNGLYDPNITGVGHQPLGFDQLKVMYDHYTVIGSKISVEVINQDANYSNQVVMYVSDANTGVGETFESLIENGNVKSMLLSPVGGSKDRGTMTMSIAPHKFLGRSHPLSDPQLKGTSSSNPTEQAFWIIQVAPNEFVDSQAVEAIVCIEYVVVFTEPKILPMS